MSKDVKRDPAVEFQIPKHIFLTGDLESGVEDSLLVKHWGFN